MSKCYCVIAISGIGICTMEEKLFVINTDFNITINLSVLWFYIFLFIGQLDWGLKEGILARERRGMEVVLGHLWMCMLVRQFCVGYTPGIDKSELKADLDLT